VANKVNVTTLPISKNNKFKHQDAEKVTDHQKFRSTSLSLNLEKSDDNVNSDEEKHMETSEAESEEDTNDAEKRAST
jgi:hypothetical protein